MINKLKFNLLIFAAVAALATIAVSVPSGKLFGKQYNTNQDFSCCKNNQLVIHHYYKTKVFGITVNSGYDLENIGKPATDCSVECTD